MTDTTMTPVVAPEATPGPRIPPLEPKPAPAAAAPGAEVGHTPGGWPVVPLAVTGTNATTSLLAAAALVGGPAALAVAATGAVVLGTVAATRKHRGNKQPRKATPRTQRSAAGSGSVGRTSSHHGGSGPVPGQARNGKAGTGKSAGRGRGKAVRGAAGSLLGTGKSSGSNNGPGRPGKSSAKHGSAAAAPSKRGSVGGTPRKSLSRAGQVKALRESARRSSPSRAARRSDTAGARRSLADARRGARSAARSASLPGRGPVGRSVGRAAGRVGSARGAAVERSRQARDRRVAALRDDVRKAPVRRAARKALRRSAARFQGRRLLAALLAGALGLVGMVSTPLGRRLGWAWLQYPGRRLYARMTCTAEEQRARRDDAICAALQEDEAAVDREAAESADRISDTAQRPKRLPSAAAPIICASEGENVSGFRFEEYAAEMESAAGQYDPEDAMEILAMVEGLPAALTSVANVMRVLAERADSEFPLEKAVADGFNDIFGALMSAVAVADDMGPLFRQSHEQDIARHEDPRNGAEAEKGWNV